MTQPAPVYPQPAIVVRSGLVALAAGVRAFFEANGVPATVPPVGWKYRTFQVNQGPGGGSRVAFIPGRIDPTAPGVPKVLDAGTFSQPQLSTPGPRLGGQTQNPGNPRPLASWHKLVSVSIWAVDPDGPQDDERQLSALENLVDWTYTAMHNAVDPVSGRNVGLADLELVDSVWTTPPVERAFGRELVLFFIQHAPVFDLFIQTTTPKPAIQKSGPT